MANPSLVVRVAANLEEFKRNLAEGRNQIETTTSGMQKLANSLGGEKLLQSAHNIVGAVNQIGGATKLTEAEKARLNVTLEKAIDKYTALGRQAPQALIDLAKETKKVETSTGEVEQKTSLLGKAYELVGPRMAAAFSVGAVVAFAREIAGFAGTMTDLSAETGVGVERLQAFNYVMTGAGVPIETFAAAVSQLSKRVASGDDSAVGALERLGFTLGEVRRMTPDELFIAVGQAVAGIEDPMERTRVSMELFGKSGTRMLRTFTEDLGTTIDEIERSGAVISAELIAKADAFDDAWQQALLRVKATAVNVAGAVAAALTSTGGQAGGFVDAKAGGAPVTPDHVRIANEAAESYDKVRKSVVGVMEASIAASEIKPISMTPEEIKKIEDALTHHAETAIGYARLMSEVMNDLGVQQMNAAKASMDWAKQSAAANAAALQQMQLDHITMVEGQVAAEAAAEAARMAANQAATDAIVAQGQAVADQASAHDALGAAAVAATSQATLGYAGLAQQVTLTGDAVRALIDLGKFNAAANAILSENKFYTDGEQLKRIAALPSPRANGGPVAAGAPYMVGERGPELFVPGRSGTIVPNGAGGGITVQVHVDARESFYDSAAGVQRMAERVGAAVVARLQSRGVAVR